MPKTFLNYKGAILASVYETDEIVANPTLEGTEQPLEGLEVGNVKYKVSGGNSDSASCFSLFDLFDYVDGKHVDVDTLVALLEEKGLYSADDTNTYPDYFSVGAGYYGYWSVSNKIIRVLGVFNSSSNYLGILGEDYELNDRIETYKETIESHVYNKSDLYSYIGTDFDILISLVANNSAADKVVFTYEEIKSIFVE